MSNRGKTAERILLICKGIAMGVANKIPGVSGGIVALSAGFYEELIFSFSRFDKKALKLLLKKDVKQFYTYVNGNFLVFLFTGVVLSFFSASLILDIFITNYPKQVWGLFFGMILASVFFIWLQAQKFSIKEYILSFIGASLGLTIAFLHPGQENSFLPFVFLCGMISISGMILPGLSGSFLILILGNYTLLLIDSVNALYFTIIDLVSWDFEFINDPNRMHLLTVILFFTLGSTTGLLVLSKILRWFLQEYPERIKAILIGFILGSLGAAWPWKKEIYKPNTNSEVLDHYELFLPKFSEMETIYVTLFIFLGFVIVTLLEINGKRNKGK